MDLIKQYVNDRLPEVSGVVPPPPHTHTHCTHFELLEVLKAVLYLSFWGCRCRSSRSPCVWCSAAHLKSPEAS